MGLKGHSGPQAQQGPCALWKATEVALHKYIWCVVGLPVSRVNHEWVAWKKERSHYWFAFYGQRSLKMEKYCIFPNPSLALGFFSNPFFLVFLVVYKRGMWPLSGFHSGKLVMLMSVFKVCSGRATNDPFPLPIHRHCESPFHELPTFDCMFCITFSHQREQTRTMVSFAPKPVHRKPF